MRAIGKSKFILCIGLLLIVAGPDPAFSQKSTWDPERVSELAGQMATELGRMRTAARKEPHVVGAKTPAKQRATAVYLETMKKLDQVAARLARELAAGKTREQTLGTARRIDSLLRDLRQQGAKVYSTDWTQKHVDPALGLAAQLRTHYGVDATWVSEEAVD